MVTMITLIALSPMSGRRTSRSIAMPRMIAKATPMTTAATMGSRKTTKAAYKV